MTRRTTRSETQNLPLVGVPVGPVPLACCSCCVSLCMLLNRISFESLLVYRLLFRRSLARCSHLLLSARRTLFRRPPASPVASRVALLRPPPPLANRRALSAFVWPSALYWTRSLSSPLCLFLTFLLCRPLRIFAVPPLSHPAQTMIMLSSEYVFRFCSSLSSLTCSRRTVRHRSGKSLCSHISAIAITFFNSKVYGLFVMPRTELAIMHAAPLRL